MTNASWVGRICAAITAGLGIATAAGVIPPKYAWIPLVVSGMVQAFQHPVMQSTNDNKAASEAVAARDVQAIR